MRSELMARSYTLRLLVDLRIISFQTLSSDEGRVEMDKSDKVERGIVVFDSKFGNT